MAEIRFYHLMSRDIDDALPEILQKAVDAGNRVLLRCHGQDIERLNQHLWTWKPESFLPHGSAQDGHAADQTIWLTSGDDNPNGAGVLVVAGGIPIQDADGFKLCCDIFNGRDEQQVASARERWKIYKESGHALTYWQQGEKGWVQKN